MQFRIQLRIVNRNELILSPDYQHQLAETLERLFRSQRAALGTWLQKYPQLNPTSRFRWYAFSGLLSENFMLKEEGEQPFLVFQGKETLELMLSVIPFPGAESHIPELFRDRELIFPGPEGKNVISISRVDGQNPPPLSSVWRLKTLSPIVARVFDQENQKFPRYLNVEDPEFPNVIHLNLKAKSTMLIEAGLFDPGQGECGFEMKWLAPPRRKLVSMRNSSGQMVKVAGWLGEFLLTADPSLLNSGYCLGFGDHNQAGFGFCRVTELGIQPGVSAPEPEVTP